MKLKTLVLCFSISISTFSLTSYAKIINLKTCVHFKQITYCMTKETAESIAYTAELQSKNNKIEVSSNVLYSDIDPTKLYLGLEKIAKNGLNLNQVSYIMGPIADDMELINSNEISKEEVTLEFANLLTIKNK